MSDNWVRVALAQRLPKSDWWTPYGSSPLSMDLNNDANKRWLEQMKYMIEYKIPITELQEELIEIYKQREREYFQTR